MKTNFTSIKLKLLLFIVTTYLAINANAVTIYVNQNALGANNGTNWADAYNNLSSALSSTVSGDNIWVAQGVYKPSTIVDLNLDGILSPLEVTFQIPDGVSLYGGFTGTEALLDERDWENNQTILSGDIDNNDINLDGNSIIEDVTQIVGANAYHVVYTENVTTATQLNGFIITAGKASVTSPVTDANGDGAGWYNRLSGVTNSSSPGIYNTTFSGNWAVSEGAAIYNTTSTAGGIVLSTIENCRFLSNKSGVNGGAIALGSFSPGNYQPTIKKCDFDSNTAFRRGGALYFIGDHAIVDSCNFRNNTVTVVSPDNSTLPGAGGGALLVGSNASFNACVFEENSTTGNPTGPFEGGGGGAVYLSMNEPQTTAFGPSEPKFSNCVFRSNVASGNTTAWGGAINQLCDAGILNPSYVNCVFVNNYAQNTGGAIAAYTRVISAPGGFVPSLTPKFTNCTFNSNEAGQRGGAIFCDGYVFMSNQILQSRIENCILWNNSAGVEGSEVYTDAENLVLYSDIQGSGGSGPGWVPSIGSDGGNNLDTSPGFINEADPVGPDNMIPSSDDGLRLSAASAVVNQGNDSAPGLTGITKDIIGNDRILSSAVDMGAYERTGLILPHFPLYWLYDWRPYFPGCLSCPWTFNFSDKILGHFIWAEPAQLIFEESGATIKGQIRSTTNREIAFNVFLKLTNQSTWKEWNALGRTYNTISLKSRLVAIRNHINWTYWELSERSYLEGSGQLAGKLYLRHSPINKRTGFQLGVAGNALDIDLGLNGNFLYHGQLVYRNKQINLKGLGDLFADAELCETNCEIKDIPNTEILKSTGTQTLGFSEDIAVYPIPATDFIHIYKSEFVANIEKAEIYDLKGALIKRFNFYPDAGSDYPLNIKEVNDGMYMLKIFIEGNEPDIEKIVIKHN